MSRSALRPTSSVSNSSRPTVAAYDIDLDTSHNSQHSSVTLGGVEYPVGAKIGKKGLFVIGDPDSSRTHSRSFDSSLPSVNTGNSQTRITKDGAGEYLYKGFDFEYWNWGLIRFLCFLGVCAIMVALLAVTIAFAIEQKQHCEANFQWWRGSVFYNIPLPKFYDSDNDQIGDLVGLEKKSGYLDHLGVGAVVLSDYLPAELKDWKRPISFTDVDYRLGDLDDFRAALDRFHRDDIKVVLTLSPWCTSTEHAWFLQSRESSAFGDAHYSDFYIWKSSAGVEGLGIWAYDPVRQQYYMHSNDTGCAILNWKDHRVHAAMEDVLEYWLEHGVDGFLFQHVAKFHVDDDLTVLTIIDVMRQKVNRYSRATGDDKILALEESYVLHLARTDTTVLEPLLSLVDLVQKPLYLPPENKTLSLRAQLDGGYRWEKQEGGPWTLWSLTGLSDVEVVDVAALQYFSLIVPGTPSITAGQEIGTFFMETKDEETKPMLWQASNIYPYLPGSVLNQTTITGLKNITQARRKAYALRLDREPLEEGKKLNYNIIESDDDVLLLSRHYGNEDMYYYAVNYGKKAIERDYVSMTAPWGTIVADSHGKLAGTQALHRITLQPRQAIVFKISK